MNKFEIRESQEIDLGAIESLYAKAFPDEDLLPLVRDLLQNPAIVTSIVAVADSQIVGHLIFMRCGLAGDNEDISLLGPLGVVPTWQGQGVGSALVRAGMRVLENRDFSLVCVLGDRSHLRPTRFSAGIVSTSALRFAY